MAIYPSINLSPQSQAVDTSINQNFTFIVAGSPITDYQIKIWDMGIIPNTLVHTSAKVALSPNKTNGDTVTHSLTGGTIVVNKKYKWQVETWSGATSAVSRQVVFESYTTPTISMVITSPVTTQSLTVSGTYAQAQSVPVNTYAFELYDNSNVLLESTDLIYGFILTHTFEGLQRDTTYKARLYGYNQVGMLYDTGLVSFNVEYAQASVLITPEATLDEDTSIVTVSWGDAVQILGTPTGTMSYIDGLVADGGKALELTNGESVEWTFNIPNNFTCTFLLKLDVGRNGDIAQLKTNYYFGYELSTQRFYIRVDGNYIYSPTQYDLQGRLFFIALRPNNFFIFESDRYDVWNKYKTGTWNDLLSSTWEEVLYK